MTGGEVSVEITGPLLTGTPSRALDRAIDNAARALAEHAHGLVLDILHAEIQNPTGHYTSRVVVDRATTGYVVSDNVIYGPWLAGVTTRNQTTRYKGMQHYRRAAQQTERQVGLIAGPHLARFAASGGATA